MAVHVLDAMTREGFEEILAIHDRRSGLRAFLAIHDTSAGPAFGGIRRFAYRDEREGLLDCLRLALAMTQKCVLAGIEGGGAKLVVFDRPGLDLAGAYGHLGRTIERLAGRYYAGPDVGTGPENLAHVAAHTTFVTSPGPDGPGELAAATATGVFAGIGAALSVLDGEPRWTDSTIVIQGMGSVGLELARRLTELGARVLGSDLDQTRLDLAREELGVVPIEAGTELDTTCDVFAPCAMGGILHDLSIQRLRARVVCGAANNLLARSLHGDRLHERGILYVPDIVVNAGAVMRGAGFHLRGVPTDLTEIEERIGVIASDVLHMASSENRSPARVALRLAADLVEARRGSSPEGESDDGPEPTNAP